MGRVLYFVMQNYHTKHWYLNTPNINHIDNICVSSNNCELFV